MRESLKETDSGVYPKWPKYNIGSKYLTTNHIALSLKKRGGGFNC